MSLDRSLKSSGGGLAKHRNVLTRAERIASLEEKGKFDWKTGSPLGLVKVGNRKAKASKVEKKVEGAEAVPGVAPAAAAAAPAAGAKGAAPAAGAKAAAPAAGAKAAAPAAKGAKK